MYQTVTAPLITFVVPAYNAVSTLEAAVRSLSEQTSDDWEAIIVDDGQVLSAVNDVNDYAGPATGYRLQGERW